MFWLFVKVTFCCLKLLNFKVCCFSCLALLYILLSGLIGCLSRKIMFCVFGVPTKLTTNCRVPLQRNGRYKK
jgi:hypothetical protein